MKLTTTDSNTYKIPVWMVQGLLARDRDDVMAWLQEQVGGPVEIIHPMGRFRDDETGCPSCDWEDRVLQRLLEVRRERRATGVVIEMPCGTDSPGFTRDLFGASSGHPDVVSTFELRSVVTVVDPVGFDGFYNGAQTLDAVGLRANEALPGHLDMLASEALVDQIEFCDVIILRDDRKQVSVLDVKTAAGYIRRLQTRAELLLWSKRQDSAVIDVFLKKLYDEQKTDEGAVKWQALIAAEPVFEQPSAGGIRAKAFVYRRRRPFHPDRFHRLADIWPHGQILRACGTVWMARTEDAPLWLNQIGRSTFVMTPDGEWLVDQDYEDRQAAFEEEPSFLQFWDESWADRWNELTFICEGLEIEDWVRTLDSCLLTDLEMKQRWVEFEDPFSEILEPPIRPRPYRHLSLVREEEA